MRMISKLSGWDDTIVSLATPPGIGAIGVIRLSGPTAIAAVSGLFSPRNLLQQESHTLHVGYIRDSGKTIDEVVVSLYRSPRSYTGEDVVEISCHGSPYIHQQVIDACIRAGARLARPGEFTQRAFLHGKMDLTQAEAVADLIASNTSASHKSALHNIRGGFSQILRNLREHLIKFSALIELELDFSQEDVAFADKPQLYKLVQEASLQVSHLLSSFKLGNVIRNGVQVAIVGRPNAGKSTLLNTLLNENRAIVSEIAGTTRDTVEEVIHIDGILFRLVDTAGLRSVTSGMIEDMGIKRSLEKIEQSDLVLYMFDASNTSPAELKEITSGQQLRDRDYILVANKSDLVSDARLFSEIPGILYISAKNGEHIEALKQRLVDSVIQGQVQVEDAIITNTRHYQALLEISRSLTDIREGLDNEIPGDLIALDIRRCLQYLGEITGEITSEDQLDFIFSKFCIGK